MAVTDSQLMIFLLDGKREYASDAAGGIVKGVQERISHLISTLEARRERLIIPTPVLAEILVKAGSAGPEYLRLFSSRAVFEIVPFDTKAAIELAEITASSGGKSPQSDPAVTKAKLKFDRQIIAIAKARNETVIYSSDSGLRTCAEREGVTVIGIQELPMPTTDPQLVIELEPEESMPPLVEDDAALSVEPSQGDEEPAGSSPEEDGGNAAELEESLVAPQSGEPALPLAQVDDPLDAGSETQDKSPAS